nr:biotin/lipoyl-binding protein [Pseudomonadota bacterium]
VAVSDTDSAGQTVWVLEAMNMERPVNAPEDGVVTDVLVTQGEQIKSGTLLMVVETTEVDAE